MRVISVLALLIVLLISSRGGYELGKWNNFQMHQEVLDAYGAARASDFFLLNLQNTYTCVMSLDSELMRFSISPTKKGIDRLMFQKKSCDESWSITSKHFPAGDKAKQRAFDIAKWEFDQWMLLVENLTRNVIAARIAFSEDEDLRATGIYEAVLSDVENSRVYRDHIVDYLREARN